MDQSITIAQEAARNPPPELEDLLTSTMQQATQLAEAPSTSVEAPDTAAVRKSSGLDAKLQVGEWRRPSCQLQPGAEREATTERHPSASVARAPQGQRISP